MNSFALIAFFAIFAAANAGLLAPNFYSAPLAAYSAPVVSAYSAPVVSAYSAPVVAGGLVGDHTVVAGPSGTISTGRTFATPAVAAYGGHGLLAARSLLI